MINVTDDLPHTSTRSIHDEGLANAIVDGSGVLLDAIVLVAIAMHMEYMRCAAVGHDIPQYLVINTHLEGRVIGEDIAIDPICLDDVLSEMNLKIFRKKSTRLTEGGSGGKVLRSGDVDLLRIPDGTVGAVKLRDVWANVLLARQSLCIDSGQEGHGFSVDHEQEGYLAVLGHDHVHFSLTVDDSRTDETGVRIFVQRNVRVIAVYPSWLVFVWACEFWYHPFVDNAATWCESRFNRWHAVFLWDLEIDSGRSIRVVGAFAGFLICEAHGVHRCIVSREIVYKQNLNDIADFGAEYGT